MTGNLIYMKQCLKCQEFKDISNFFTDHRSGKLRSICKPCNRSYRGTKAKQSEWYYKNRERLLASRKEWLKNNPNKAKNQDLKRSYGITLDQYNEILSFQNNLCAICKKPNTAVDKKTGKTKALAVDHCHKTGKIRGLLCEAHNRALGMFHDSLEELQSAIDYLIKAKNNDDHQ